MFLLDTNILIDYQKGHKEAISVLDFFTAENLSLSTSVICAMELLKGHKNKIGFQKTQALLNFLTIIPITEIISQKAYELFCQYYLSHNLDLSDSLIASTALVYNIKLLTLNQKHFQIINI